MATVGRHITNMRTAFTRYRNIRDTIRIINSAIELANQEIVVSGSIVALDPQKAFDSASRRNLIDLLKA
jgi:hypothetical protein